MSIFGFLHKKQEELHEERLAEELHEKAWKDNLTLLRAQIGAQDMRRILRSGLLNVVANRRIGVLTEIVTILSSLNEQDILDIRAFGINNMLERYRSEE